MGQACSYTWGKTNSGRQIWIIYLFQSSGKVVHFRIETWPFPSGNSGKWNHDDGLEVEGDQRENQFLNGTEHKLTMVPQPINDVIVGYWSNLAVTIDWLTERRKQSTDFVVVKFPQNFVSAWVLHSTNERQKIRSALNPFGQWVIGYVHVFSVSRFCESA